MGDGTFLCNPWLLTWEEFLPEDVIRIDIDGNVLEGDWPAPLGIPIHLELHKARPGIAWAVHGHTEWGSVWSAMKRVPPLHDQTGAGGGGKLVLVDEYGGGVSNVASAKDAIERLGDADAAILAHHGVLLTAKNVNAAYWRGVAGVALPPRTARGDGRRRRTGAAGRARHVRPERRHGLRRLLGDRGATRTAPVP